MTETLQDKGEIAEVAVEILREPEWRGESLTTEQLMNEFRVNDVDAPVTLFWEALTEDERIAKIGESEAWRLADE